MLLGSSSPVYHSGGVQLPVKRRHQYIDFVTANDQWRQ
jgi:hypothetical protein